jgi:hypothetical protein
MDKGTLIDNSWLFFNNVDPFALRTHFEAQQLGVAMRESEVKLSPKGPHQAVPLYVPLVKVVQHDWFLCSARMRAEHKKTRPGDRCPLGARNTVHKRDPRSRW